MKRLRIFLLVAALTLVLQLVTDHIMRTTLNRATYLFVGVVAGGCGLVALLLVKLINKQSQ